MLDLLNFVQNGVVTNVDFVSILRILHTTLELQFGVCVAIPEIN